MGTEILEIVAGQGCGEVEWSWQLGFLPGF